LNRQSRASQAELVEDKAPTTVASSQSSIRNKYASHAFSLDVPSGPPSRKQPMKKNQSALRPEANQSSLAQANTPEANLTSKSRLEKSCVTPMPDYTHMNTPTLRGELKRFGVKPLSKRQAVRKLVEIYEYTHRKKLDSKFPRSMSCMQLSTAASEKQQQSTATVTVMSETSKKKLSRATSETTSLAAKYKTLSRQESAASYDAEAESKRSSIGESAERTIDELMLELIEAESQQSDRSSSSENESSAQETSKKKAKSAGAAGRRRRAMDERELRAYVCDYIRADEILHAKVLNYEPLDYESLQRALKERLTRGSNDSEKEPSRTFDNKLLMRVLDDMCVTFTLKGLAGKSGHAARAKLMSRNKH
jgi:hypothetical protein